MPRCPGDGRLGIPTRCPSPCWFHRLVRMLFRTPGPSRPFLDIAPDQPPHDLGRRGVLLGAQALKESLLPWVDENRQACSTVFEGHGCGLARQTGKLDYNRM